MKERLIAKRYAKALFASCSSNDIALQINEQLLQIATIYQNSNEFLALTMESPSFSPQERIGIISCLCEYLKHHDLTKSFLSLLVSKKRIHLISLISEIFGDEIDFHNNITKANIESAQPLSQKDIDNIVNLLNNYIGTKISVKHTINSNLIGGVKVQMGGFVFDNTVEGQLQNMQKNLLS